MIGNNIREQLEYFKEEADNYIVEGLGDVIILNSEELKGFLGNNKIDIKYIDTDTYEMVKGKLNNINITISVL